MGVLIRWAVFQIPKPRVPDSTNKNFLEYDSGFHKQKFSQILVSFKRSGILGPEHCFPEVLSVMFQQGGCGTHVSLRPPPLALAICGWKRTSCMSVVNKVCDCVSVWGGSNSWVCGWNPRCDHSNESYWVVLSCGTVIIIMLYKVVLAFAPVDEIPKCNHSNESYWPVLSCGIVNYAVQGGSNFCICGWNPEV